MSYSRPEDFPPAGPVRFHTAAELDDLVPPRVDWILWGLLAVGGITELTGKIKAAGKTTLSLYAMKATLDGAAFLGRPARQARVVYVTEQSGQTFIDALRRAGLNRRGDEFRIVLRESLGAIGWEELVGQVRLDGYDVCVFDTIGKLAGVTVENDAHEWAMAMAPLQDLAASGRAVLIDRHDRKGGGEVGESGRGSSQASGDADIILQLRRPEGNQPSTRRVLETLSRYQETPEKLVVELHADGYVLLGDDEAVAHADALRFIRFLLTYGLETNPFPLSSGELLARAKDERGLAEATVRRALTELVALGELTVSGKGVKGSPYLYNRPAPAPPNDSFHTPVSSETNESAAPANGVHLDPAAAFARYREESGGTGWERVKPA